MATAALGRSQGEATAETAACPAVKQCWWHLAPWWRNSWKRDGYEVHVLRPKQREVMPKEQTAHAARPMEGLPVAHDVSKCHKGIGLRHSPHTQSQMSLHMRAWYQPQARVATTISFSPSPINFSQSPTNTRPSHGHSSPLLPTTTNPALPYVHAQGPQRPPP